MKIYTRTGDKGQTSLFGGKRVGKDDVRVEAYGTIDELNSAIGLTIAMINDKGLRMKNELVKIQNDLFDIGSILASSSKTLNLKPITLKSRVTEFEELIDELTEKLPQLRNFILPGGGKAGASLHLARAVCRRAERRVIALAKKEQVTSEIIIYLNRLSDLLFTIARFVNQQEKKKEIIWVKSVSGSQAFNVEYLQNVYDRELRDDVISYLGEYRFNLQKYNYQLRFSTGEDGLRLRDIYGGEALSSKAKRAIEKRKRFGEPVAREEAELWGIISLEDQLRFAQNGDTILWASPTGPREEGYGNYGFLYAGNVLGSGQSLHLSMTAIRIEQPTIAQFNQAFAILSGIRTDFDSAEDFLQSPRLVRGYIGVDLIEEVLHQQFSFAKNKSETVFGKVMNKLSPMVEEFIKLVKTAGRKEKLSTFYALENYALELKARYDSGGEGRVIFFDDFYDYRLQELVRRFGHEPPRVAGSCGPSGKTRSNGLFNRDFELLRRAIFDLEDDDFGSRQFRCPDCKETNIRPYNQRLPACQHCGSTSVAC
ncbi:cob(I)yrinic acid a,c-diamide adenosyltransferase [Candidatus Microgenomates bacterium]|nr:cob(I)yrinic acid a,c-diamide adenosyltransferase [Candidatus Microgenomates bacterium]